ncbi:MAG: energy transducer TonB [Alphaproteobacteria bacterium]|nr:energy transducer TonB [Alphaproteobacteria bacterium]MCB9794451.1 energy transducer TonB [Alphaproteobacteria bacterium]
MIWLPALLLAFDPPSDAPPPPLPDAGPQVADEERRNLLPAELTELGLTLPSYPEGATASSICDVELSADAEGALEARFVKGCAAPFVAAVEAVTGSWQLPTCDEALCHYVLSIKLTPELVDWSVPPAEVHWSEVKVKKRVNPSFPDEMKARNVEGSCRLRIYIDERGVPYRITTESCDPGFEQSAIEACEKWRFYPMKRDGVAIPAQFVLSIRFKLS